MDEGVNRQGVQELMREYDALEARGRVLSGV